MPSRVYASEETFHHNPHQEGVSSSPPPQTQDGGERKVRSRENGGDLGGGGDHGRKSRPFGVTSSSNGSSGVDAGNPPRLRRNRGPNTITTRKTGGGGGSSSSTKKSSSQKNGGSFGVGPSGHPSQGSLSTGTSTEERHKELDTPIQNLYEIRTRLGKGAYGIVWEAVEKISGSGKKVALKKIFDAFRNNTDAQRTYREIMFLKSFGHHPKIIQLINVHRAENDLDIYLVFPLMDHDLHKIIKWKPNVLTETVIRQIAYEMLVGIHYLHSAEVIHRDLKPANILLDKDFHVKLADFGLSRSLAGSEDGGGAADNYLDNHEMNPVMTEYVATRWYRPLEILLSCRMYTKGVDMWAVACILGEMYLTKPMFPGSSTLDQIELIMAMIPRPSELEIEDMMSGTAKATLHAALKATMEQKRGPNIFEIFYQWNCDLVDFLERLLVFTPGRRLTAEEGLCHPYFKDVRDHRIETVCEGPVRPPLSDSVQLGLEEYRETIYEVIKMCHDEMEESGRDWNRQEEEGEILDLYRIPEEDRDVKGLEDEEAIVKDLYSSSSSFGENGGEGRMSPPSRRQVMLEKSKSEEYGYQQPRQGRNLKSVLTIPPRPITSSKRIGGSVIEAITGGGGVARSGELTHSLSSGALVLSKNYLEEEEKGEGDEEDYKFEYVINGKGMMGMEGDDKEEFGWRKSNNNLLDRYRENGSGDGVGVGGVDEVYFNGAYFEKKVGGSSGYNGAADDTLDLDLLTNKYNGREKMEESNRKLMTRGFSSSESSSSSVNGGGVRGGDQTDFSFKYPFPPTTPRKNYRTESTTGPITSTSTGTDPMTTALLNSTTSVSGVEGLTGTGGKRNPFSEYTQLLQNRAASNGSFRSSGVRQTVNPQDISRRPDSNAIRKFDKLLLRPPQNLGGGGDAGGGGDIGKRLEMGQQRRVNSKGKIMTVTQTPVVASGSIDRISSSSMYPPPAANQQVIDDLVLVNGRNRENTRNFRSPPESLIDQQKNLKPEYYRFGGIKETEPEPVRRPFNGRSHYGKLHKLPSVTALPVQPSNQHQQAPPPQRRVTMTTSWSNDTSYHFPRKPNGGISERTSRSSSMRNLSTKPQLSQSAYFPSTTLYSKTISSTYGNGGSMNGPSDLGGNRRKAVSEPSYTRQAPAKGSSHHLHRFSTRNKNLPHQQIPKRQNWTEPVYPEMTTAMHASDLFDLQHNIQRP